MRKMIWAMCVLSLAAIASHAAAATTYHVFATADNVSPNFTTVQAAVTAVRAGTGGDTISIDDSTTYSLTTPTAIAAINKPNTTIVAAPGQNPVLVTNSGTFAFNLTAAGCRVGSLDGGTITIDGNNGGGRRGIYFDNSINAVGWEAASTNTLENVVFKNFGFAAAQTSCYQVIVGQASGTKNMPDGTVFNIRYVDMQFPVGIPSVTTDANNNYTGIRLNLTGAGVANVENVRATTMMGFALTGGAETMDKANDSGIINMKNCRFVYDEPTMINDPRMGCPVALMNMFDGATAAGFTLNVDNSYIRSDATKSGNLDETHVDPARSGAETSNSLGAISLLNYSKNVLNMTNSAVVGCGSGINVDSAHSAIQLTNCDVYVPTAAQVTAGNFINLSPRANTATSADHQCTATRCNLYGLAGSDIQASSRGAGSVFTMVQCNDWSPVNAYASNWVTSNCVQPGLNPGYGNNSDPAPAIAAKDFTVYNNTIKAQNIGADRDFNFGVPVELSSFSVL